jgi:hypothetical protein
MSILMEQQKSILILVLEYQEHCLNLRKMFWPIDNILPSQRKSLIYG